MEGQRTSNRGKPPIEGQTLCLLAPLQLGKVLNPLNVEDDLLEEMLSDSRD